jgi:5,10-methylenetetrahydromethanopterin reductase
VPVLIGAQGPKGNAVAKALADGLFTVAAVPAFAPEFSWVPHLCDGTVLDEGEDPRSERVRAAAGPGVSAKYHGAYDLDVDMGQLPGGEEWLAVIEEAPERERHLAVHDQHMVGLNAADEAAWGAGADTMAEALTFTGTAAALRARAAELAHQGVTEIVYQPAGPDINRELETFIEAVRA